ncbi:SGNH hydrolase [Trametes elegans]|nr:SGNH hydrolase [Trametes elegans]
MRVLVAATALCVLTALRVLAAQASLPKEVIFRHDHPLIYYHGRWDASPGTWWASSGFKLHVQDLSTLTLNLGPHTTTPLASVGVSVGHEPFYTVNVSAGANVIPLKKLEGEASTTTVRINVEGWQNNRINLESIALNEGAKLLPYVPSKLAFQFIGDSLSAGQYLPQGVNQAWPFLTGEYFKAEHRINAQPGAALSDIVSYGNVHGVSYQYFRTEDTGYVWTSDHNYTTPWDFGRERPAATHIVIHIGCVATVSVCSVALYFPGDNRANDASQNVTAESFVETYQAFLTRLRTLCPDQPIFIFTPWGWPAADGSTSYYYDGQYAKIVQDRHLVGDHNTFLVNTTDWVTWEDVFPDNQHPNVPGHQKIATRFEEWLEGWGLRPELKANTVQF